MKRELTHKMDCEEGPSCVREGSIQYVAPGKEEKSGFNKKRIDPRSRHITITLTSAQDSITFTELSDRIPHFYLASTVL